MRRDIEVTLDWREMQRAAMVGVERQIEAMRAGRQDRHGLDPEDGFKVHCLGAIGECALAKALNRYWDGGVNTFKAGDVGRLQVRLRTKMHYDLLIRSSDSDDDAFALITGVGPSFVVRGWVWGREAKCDEWLKEYGEREPAWFVPQAVLRGFK